MTEARDAGRVTVKALDESVLELPPVVENVWGEELRGFASKGLREPRC